MGGRALGNGTSALLKGAPHFSPPGAHSEETRLGARSVPPQHWTHQQPGLGLPASELEKQMSAVRAARATGL